MRRIGLALLTLAACGRSGFDVDTVPGLGDHGGLMVSTPRALVLEDGHYDAAPAADGRGYALAWIEYPPADRTANLMFAVVGENEELVVTPTTIAVLPDKPGGVRIWSSPAGYLLVADDRSDHLFFGIDTAGSVVARRADRTYLYEGLEMAASADGFVAVFTATMSIRSFTLDARGAPRTAPAAVEMQATEQFDPAIAVSSDGQLAAAWVDERTGTTKQRIRFVRLDAGGRPLAPSVPIYENGMPQGLPYLVPDGETGFLMSYDGYSKFPQNMIRIDAAGSPVWPSPVVIYNEANYHDTLDVAGAIDGRAGFAWVTEDQTLLTNIEFMSVDGHVAEPPAVPAPALVTDPRYSFCYPEIARATASFGAAFAGEVEGSLGLFLVIVPDR